MNPYRWFPELYTDDKRKEYLVFDRPKLDPHVYTTSSFAYSGLQETKSNQTILVSGESGAGKTETVKILMAHLAFMASSDDTSHIKRIVESNPLLESFGNAQTVRNDNSSRFGKFIELQLDSGCRLEGRVNKLSWKFSSIAEVLSARILAFRGGKPYLLQGAMFALFCTFEERNFHIFYQMLAADAETRTAIGLGDSSLSRDESSKLADCAGQAAAAAQVLAVDAGHPGSIGWWSRSAKQLVRHLSARLALSDIFGFESFAINRFEQLCINYANEKLQQKFTHDVFKAVQQEYTAEGIPWDRIEFKDNAPILALIESKLGIVAMLNEECVRPKGSNENFVSKLLSVHKEDGAFSVPKLGKMRELQFCIRHYAGEVMYTAEGWLDRNNDTVSEDVINLMRGSGNELLASLFTEESKAKRDTVVTKFKTSLSQLMETIGQTNTQYVRCIKPNQNKSPREVNNEMVVDQLRCAGVIEAIRISRAGFPARMPLRAT
ncbi:MYO5C [Symbiodinium necroappetens]|uniref:MYO5C protein n=1 Tax=Symbiodinium necroappetens TaxID=1628268 RepID=A0A812QDA8_9DINO|nr:MYO5C [Symbiodinium necroappetens]